MARVHKIMAKDPLNSPGVLRCSNGELTNSHKESARVLLDTHFPGNVTNNDSNTTNNFEENAQMDAHFINEVVTYDQHYTH